MQTEIDAGESSLTGITRAMQFELLRNHEQVEALEAEAFRLLTEVRRSIRHHPDVCLTTRYFLANLSPNRQPRVVACYSQGTLIGVVYAAELYVWRLRTGFIFGGDQMGRGLVLALPEQEQEILTAACAFLLKNGLHAMRLHWTPQLPLLIRDISLPEGSARVRQKLDLHPEGDWLRLEPTYDAFLARIGAHTRRNLRYYRRKVEGIGFHYSGVLGEEDVTNALRSLNEGADYPVTQFRLDRDRRFFSAFQTPVIAGLRDSRGNFISLITGFVTGTELHILTQLNGEGEVLRRLSLSLVLRGYVIEDFIQRGFTAVHFINGSSPMLGRFCEPVHLQVIAIDDRSAWMALFKKGCSSLVGLLRRSGRRVPYRLQRAAGTYLR